MLLAWSNNSENALCRLQKYLSVFLISMASNWFEPYIHKKLLRHNAPMVFVLCGAGWITS